MKKIKLGEDALVYVREVLEYDNHLCSDISNRIQGGTFGQAFTYLLNDTVIENLNFHQGGVNRGGISYLSSYLVEQYGSKKSHLILFDDVMAGEDDDFNSENSYKHIVINGEVFHVQWMKKTNTQELRKTIQATSVSWHFLCGIYQVSENIELSNIQKELIEENFDGKLQEFICGAFDGEGFIHYKL